MRTGVLLRAVCQVLLQMFSVRFASGPLALRIHSLGLAAAWSFLACYRFDFAADLTLICSASLLFVATSTARLRRLLAEPPDAHGRNGLRLAAVSYTKSVRAGVLMRAVCQVLLHILNARFASSPLVLGAHSHRVLAMPHAVNMSRLSQDHAFLQVVFRWFYVTSIFVKNIIVGAYSARYVNVRMCAVDDTQNQGTDEAEERRTDCSSSAW